MQLANAVVLVTGGSSGIGKGIAETLVRAGAKVAITGRDKARLTATATAIGAHAIQADVSKEDDATRTGTRGDRNVRSPRRAGQQRAAWVC
jgi:NADP-dependent 3-hydroxy acid dehydrogenase YdfG